MRQEMEAVVTEVFDRRLKLLTSIKGIGVTLATALIIATGGFTYFDNAKQLSRFIGICPTIEQCITSGDISTVTVMRLCVQCFMWRHGQQVSTTRRARNATNDYEAMENPARLP